MKLFCWLPIDQPQEYDLESFFVMAKTKKDAMKSIKEYIITKTTEYPKGTPWLDVWPGRYNLKILRVNQVATNSNC